MSFAILWTENALASVQRQADYLASHTERDPEAWVSELFEVVGGLADFPPHGTAMACRR